MTFLKKWWGAILAVVAAIAAGVGVFLMGRRTGIADEAHDAATEDVKETEARGEDLVREAEENGNDKVDAAETSYLESVDAHPDESADELLGRLARRRGDG